MAAAPGTAGGLGAVGRRPARLGALGTAPAPAPRRPADIPYKAAAGKCIMATCLASQLQCATYTKVHWCRREAWRIGTGFPALSENLLLHQPFSSFLCLLVFIIYKSETNENLVCLPRARNAVTSLEPSGVVSQNKEIPQNFNIYVVFPSRIICWMEKLES